MYTSSQVLDV